MRYNIKDIIINPLYKHRTQKAFKNLDKTTNEVYIIKVKKEVLR